MQNAKDTFYELLRSRIATANPERTIVLRGVTRPGALVEENELVSTITMPDCFRLQLGRRECGRGECDARRNADLRGDVRDCRNRRQCRHGSRTSADGDGCGACWSNQCSPQKMLKQNYAALATGGTCDGDEHEHLVERCCVRPLVVKADRIARMAKVTVMSCEEAGEL